MFSMAYIITGGEFRLSKPISPQKSCYFLLFRIKQPKVFVNRIVIGKKKKIIITLLKIICPTCFLPSIESKFIAPWHMDIILSKLCNSCNNTTAVEWNWMENAICKMNDIYIYIYIKDHTCIKHIILTGILYYMIIHL